MSTQPDAQRYCAAGQPAAHIPVEPSHVGVEGGQTLPHAPQLRPSKRRLTHWVPHIVEAPAHVHAPATHVCPPGQMLPQAPQLALDEVMSVHTPPQLAEPDGHAHTPALQL